MVHFSVDKYNSSVISPEPNCTVFNFPIFFKDFKDSCVRLQGNRRANEGTEDDKTLFIRDMLHTLGYKALDQTQRGKSPTGLQPGEVDLLICNSDMLPSIIIEALILKAINKSNIKFHINKVSKYDANGLEKTIILVYVYSVDFEAFANRYKKYIESADFVYPLIEVKDISNNGFSELKVMTSQFYRSGINREMLHVLVNLS